MKFLGVLELILTLIIITESKCNYIEKFKLTNENFYMLWGGFVTIAVILFIGIIIVFSVKAIIG